MTDPRGLREAGKGLACSSGRHRTLKWLRGAEVGLVSKVRTRARSLVQMETGAPERKLESWPPGRPYRVPAW